MKRQRNDDSLRRLVRHDGPPERLIDASQDFSAGWKAAMQAVWDRLPSPEYANDPMTPQEVQRLLEFVKSQLPNIEAEAER